MLLTPPSPLTDVMLLKVIALAKTLSASTKVNSLSKSLPLMLLTPPSPSTDETPLNVISLAKTLSVSTKVNCSSELVPIIVPPVVLTLVKLLNVAPATSNREAVVVRLKVLLLEPDTKLVPVTVPVYEISLVIPKILNSLPTEILLLPVRFSPTNTKLPPS